VRQKPPFLQIGSNAIGIVGSDVGQPLGVKVVGFAEGFALGEEEEGVVLGFAEDGLAEGLVVGLTDGTTEDGFAVGLNEDGLAEGLAVGFTEGTTEDGFEVGFTVDGLAVVGLVVGLEDGDCVVAMNPVSVTQLAGLEQCPPISQEPVQQLALTVQGWPYIFKAHEVSSMHCE